jgi:hypothetical protein
MKRLFAAALALLLMGQAPPPARVSDLAWMSGRWVPETWNERWQEEIWSEPRGGIMLGYGRSGDGERLQEFELLRIQADEDGVPIYYAQLGNRAPVGFRLVAHDAAGATFENPQHDFPQRIRYERVGSDTMWATISALDGSNAMRWQFRRQH